MIKATHFILDGPLVTPLPWLRTRPSRTWKSSSRLIAPTQDQLRGSNRRLYLGVISRAFNSETDAPPDGEGWSQQASRVRIGREAEKRTVFPELSRGLPAMPGGAVTFEPVGTKSEMFVVTFGDVFAREPFLVSLSWSWGIG